MPRRKRGAFKKEPYKCVCQLGQDSAAEHHKPKAMTGLHLHEDCRHSELLNAVYIYPTKVAERTAFLEQQAKRNKGKPIKRMVVAA